MNKNEFKKTDLIAIAGILMFAEFGKGGKFGRSPTDPPQGTGRNKNGDKMCMGA